MKDALRRRFDAAAEIGVATFMRLADQRDAQIFKALSEAGVADWLASRLVCFVPVAFGRVLLKGAEFSDALDDGHAQTKLADDPVWCACEARARVANRDEMKVIAFRSAEVAAANQALSARADARLEDLAFSPVSLPARLPPLEQSDAGAPSPLEVFAHMLHAHGLQPVDVDDDTAGAGAGVRVGDVVFRAQVFPSKERSGWVQLDLRASTESVGPGEIIESAAGIGTTWRDAIVQAIEKLERGSFHVLVAALVDRAQCADQVEWMKAWLPGFDACVGPSLTLYAGEPRADVAPLLDALRTELSRARLRTDRVHALRVFACCSDGALTTVEVLLDNESWAPGVELVKRYPWHPSKEGLWATRLFAMIAPALQ